MKNLSLIILSIFLIAFSSCDVHEEPSRIEETFDFELTLNFNTALPLHKVVTYTRSAEKLPDIRYVIKVYKVKGENDDSRIENQTFIFSRPYSSNPDYSVRLPLPAGSYRFRVWTDYVDAGSQADKYYTTSDFAAISLDKNDIHHGSTEYRDAFKGNVYGIVYDCNLYVYENGNFPPNRATVDMSRPMGRYEFISTDLEEFLDRVYKTRVDDTENFRGWQGLSPSQIAENINLDDYTVVFRYNAFMPSTYNHFMNFNGDSATGVTYESKMKITDEGMQMGFDYVFTPDETEMNLSMEVYNTEGELIALTGSVKVPVANSKNTIVKGEFLSAISSGGVSVNPGFDGDDFNIEIR